MTIKSPFINNKFNFNQSHDLKEEHFLVRIEFGFLIIQFALSQITVRQRNFGCEIVDLTE